MADRPLIRIEDLHKTYGDAEVIKGISFNVQEQDVVVIIGPSGTGKSTMLRCINLLTRPDKGRIWLEEQEITAPHTDINKIRQRIGMVFQDFNLFNHLTALGNVTIGFGGRGKSPLGIGASRPVRQSRSVPGPTIRRPKAASRYCPRSGYGPSRDALR